MATMSKRRTQRKKRVRAETGSQSVGLESQHGIHPLATLEPMTGAPSHGSLSLTNADWEAISACLAFSTRESQIARLVLDDVTEATIAVRLSISPRTVHSHVERLYRKLRVHSSRQLLVRIFNAYMTAVAFKR